LFRPPYSEDLEPQTIDGVQPLLVSASLGYITLGMNIDPKDFLRPRSQLIATHTVDGAIKGKGNVVLLHDGGGNRSPTVEALPVIIDTLRAEGFRFVTVHELLKVSRDAVMPYVGREDAIIVAINRMWFTLYQGLNSFFVLIFQAGIMLGTVRLLLLGGLAMLHASREQRRLSRTWSAPSLAVVIPAYNEEKVICGTVRTMLASLPPNCEIIIVDDGSTDRTAQVVRETFGHLPSVKVLTKSNAGKPAALNYGIAHTNAEVIVMIDADTVPELGAIQYLVRHFTDPRVGAVAGAVGVGNRVNLLTRFQALEYMISQNLDRRALEIMNAIFVVPGAIGAWRREALMAIGGFSDDTMAEDADATLRLERAGWKVLYEPRASAITEAPETVRMFLKQRFRWMFGTLQTVFKHRSVMLRCRPPGVALFGMPNVLIFQYLLMVVGPIMDVILAWSIVWGIREIQMHPNDGVPTNLVLVAAFWAYFQFLDVVTAIMAMSVERTGKVWRLLPLLILQRFCYRQLLYVIAVRVALTALKGTMVGWNKLLRTGRALNPVAR
jgi:cellulose synthase/poly-beta-1,6-N-acetylglucosamine synthase-like glycosyltransferase